MGLMGVRGLASRMGVPEEAKPGQRQRNEEHPDEDEKTTMP
jgi:hypothetical protein